MDRTRRRTTPTRPRQPGGSKGDRVTGRERPSSTIVEQPVGLVARARVEVARLDRLLDSPALRDLRLATMRAFNVGPLAPQRARRTAGSPIAGAQNTLIPIYATLGRSPGEAAFDSPKLLEGLERCDDEREKEKGWIGGTMFLPICS